MPVEAIEAQATATTPAPVVEAAEAKTVAPADAAKPAEAKPEAKPTPDAAEKQREAANAARFAAIAKKEKILLAKQRESAAAIDAERRALAAQKAEFTKQAEEVAKLREQLTAWEQTKAKAKLDPLRALNDVLGIDYDDLVAAKLNDGKPTADLHAKAVRDELEAYKAQIESRLKAQDEARAKAVEAEKARIAAEQQAVIEQFHADVATHVEGNADKYELINLHGAQQAVIELVEAHHAKTKRLLSISEAADMVEKHLEEQIEKSLATKKWQSKAKASPQPQAEEKRPVESAKPRAITNDIAPTTPVVIGTPLSDRERINRALAAMNRQMDEAKR